jgi:hypothetical protein
MLAAFLTNSFHRKRLRGLVGTGGLAIAAALSPSYAVSQSPIHQSTLDHSTHTAEKPVGLSNGSFIAAPIPIQNPTVGTGLALGGGYLFTLDEESQASFIGIGGFRTNNESNGYAVGGKLNFGEGRWTVKASAGYADLTYDLFVGDVPFGINQTGAIAQASLAYGVTKAFSVGLELGYVESEIGPGNAPNLPEDIQLAFGISTGTADLLLQYDSRNDTIYPTTGLNGSLSVGRGTILDGPSRDFQRGLAKLGFFVPVSESGVVAGQLAMCNVDRETPFFLSCSLGGSDAFRGYSSTQNIDDALASFQIAFRGLVGKRFGYAVFAGTGRVARTLGDLSSAPDLSAAGLGARYRLSRKFPVDFSVDVAVNLDEEVTTYVYVGQRF